MRFSRFLAWLAVTSGVSLIFVRYGFGESSWGSDAVWTVAGACLATGKVHESLVAMWSKP